MYELDQLSSRRMIHFIHLTTITNWVMQFRGKHSFWYQCLLLCGLLVGGDRSTLRKSSCATTESISHSYWVNLSLILSQSVTHTEPISYSYWANQSLILSQSVTQTRPISHSYWANWSLILSQSVTHTDPIRNSYRPNRSLILSQSVTHTEPVGHSCHYGVVHKVYTISFFANYGHLSWAAIILKIITKLSFNWLVFYEKRLILYEGSISTYFGVLT